LNGHGLKLIDLLGTSSVAFKANCASWVKQNPASKATACEGKTCVEIIFAANSYEVKFISTMVSRVCLGTAFKESAWRANV